MRYEDFVVHIGGRREDSYAVRVLQSPAGEGAGRFKPPVDKEEVASFALALREADIAARDASLARDLIRRRKTRPGLSPKELGQRLFDSIFDGQVARLYDRSLGQLQGQDDVGLRIKLRFDSDALSEGELEGLPWELMYRAETGRYLGLDRRSSIVRYLDVAQPARPIPLPECLRILIVISEAQGLAKLDLKSEFQRILELSEGQESWHLELEENASISALRRRLATDGPFHVVHFMGHGGFDRVSGEGLLYFETENGEAQPVSGQDLAMKLADFPDLGLVFLNACETANASAGRDPFAGVANALVRGGVPAVIAMQKPIADRAAIAFSDAFYTNLARGACADEALVEGRQAIHSAGALGTGTHAIPAASASTDSSHAASSGSVDWMIPVLFARVRDGALFTAPAEETVPGQDTASGHNTAPDADQIRSTGRIALASLVAMAFLVLAWVAAGYLAPGLFTARGESFTLDRVFATSVDEVEGRLRSVEIMPDGTMRLFFEFENRTEENQKIGFDFEKTYLADENGHPYEVLGTSLPLDTPVLEQALAPGVASSIWIDLPAPLDGAKRFGVALAKAENADVTVPFFEVELPEYDSKLARTSKEAAPLPGIETFKSGMALDASNRDLEALVDRIELEVGRSMRWNLALINRTAENLAVDFDLDKVVLVDNLGNTYQAQGFGFYQGQEFFDGVEMKRGLRSEPWFEFPPPKPGASSFTFRLATKPGSQIRFEKAKVEVEGLSTPSSEAAAPANLLSAPRVIKTNQAEIRAELLAIERTAEGRMRWRLRVKNHGERDKSWGLDYPQTYLADSAGRRYDPIAAEPEANVKKEGFRATLVAGSRALSWLDFSAPLADSGTLTLRLASSTKGLSFESVRVTGLSWPGAKAAPPPRPPRNAHRLPIAKPVQAPAGLTARLETVDLFAGDRARFTIRWQNSGERAEPIGLDATALRLVDGELRNYRIARVEEAKTLLPGLADAVAFETESPRNGARVFDLELEGRGLKTQQLRFELPAYPAEFSRTEERAVASFELGEGEHEIPTTLEGLRAKLIGIDHLGNGRLRWHLELYNEGERTLDVGYDPAVTKLLMGGKTYRLSQTDAGQSSDPIQRQLARGQAWRPWLEFAGSFQGDEDFDLLLGSPQSSVYRYRLTAASLADIARAPASTTP